MTQQQTHSNRPEYIDQKTEFHSFYEFLIHKENKG